MTLCEADLRFKAKALNQNLLGFLFFYLTSPSHPFVGGTIRLSPAHAYAIRLLPPARRVRGPSFSSQLHLRAYFSHFPCHQTIQRFPSVCRSASLNSSSSKSSPPSSYLSETAAPGRKQRSGYFFTQTSDMKGPAVFHADNILVINHVSYKLVGHVRKPWSPCPLPLLLLPG